MNIMQLETRTSASILCGVCVFVKTNDWIKKLKSSIISSTVQNINMVDWSNKATKRYGEDLASQILVLKAL